MNISITRSVADDLNYLKELLAEIARTAELSQAKIIGRFTGKVLQPQIDRLTAKPETYEEELSIPDDLVKQLAGKAGVDILTPGAAEVPAQPALGTSTSPFQAPVPEYHHDVKNGNGHKIEKKRDLTDSEKDSLRAFFVSMDGQIEEDACVAIKKGMADDVAIFQVTGFISYLHVKVASGEIKLRDIDAYVEWMKSKYPALLERYNSEKYVKLRAAATTFTAPTP